MQYVAEIALALDYLHNDLRVVHRDIKPDNVLIDDGYNAKLAGAPRRLEPNCCPPARPRRLLTAPAVSAHRWRGETQLTPPVVCGFRSMPRPDQRYGCRRASHSHCLALRRVDTHPSCFFLG